MSEIAILEELRKITALLEEIRDQGYEDEEDEDEEPEYKQDDLDDFKEKKK